MKTEERKREYSPMGVEARYDAPKAWIHPDRERSWIKRMLPIVWANRRTFVPGLGATLVTEGIQMTIPLVIGLAVDQAIDRQTRPVRVFVITLCILALARLAFGFVSRYGMMRSAYGIEYDLRAIIYEHLSRLSFSFYDRVQTGQLISRANSDIRSVQMFLAFAPMMMITILGFFAAFGIMVTISWPLTLAALVPLPGVWWFGMKMRKLMFPISWIVQARMADVATIVDENVTGVRIVKSFAAEVQQIEQLAHAARRTQWAAVKQVDVRARFAPILQNLPGLSLVIVLFYGGYLVTEGRIGVGVIIAFMGYVVRLQAPFRILGFLLMLSQRAAASAERIYEIMDTPSDVQDRPDATDLVDPRGDVEFRGVTFGYGDDPPILDDLSLRIEPGETVALVGRTGCGKSTIARLLMRFYDVRDGTVAVDDRDVRDITQESLRSHIGLVADDAFLFSDTIRDNIAYGRPNAPFEDVVAAAGAAGADAFIRALPDGYDTVIGERGYDLSGGQRQRVSIARLLVTDPFILILDDATSSVDVKIEEEIHGALRNVMEGRTTLIIAHRLSTISLADRVVLMERGRIVASGSHSELMRTEPRYAEVLARLEEDEARLRAERAARRERDRQAVENGGGRRDGGMNVPVGEWEGGS